MGRERVAAAVAVLGEDVRQVGINTRNDQLDLVYFRFLFFGVFFLNVEDGKRNPSNQKKKNLEEVSITQKNLNLDLDLAYLRSRPFLFFFLKKDFFLKKKERKNRNLYHIDVFFLNL